jgi:photosystem II CP47 chlorophyll apoprotein
VFEWSLGIDISSEAYWTYESVLLSHIVLSGLLILAAFWHWAYWDLDLFLYAFTGKLVLDLNRVFGIHLCLASLLCYGFGLAHLTGLYGPGMWTSDSFGIVGSVRNVKPIYSIIGLSPFCYGVITANHIVAGFFGIAIGLWHIATRPGPFLYKQLGMANIESVLASSLAAVFFIAFITSSLMWYGSVSTALELYGPTRYHWDNGYFSLDIERRVNLNSGVLLSKAFSQVPEKLIIYDYIGGNPSKGGLFRSGPMLKGDGLIQSWLGHASFELGTLSLAVRRMPAFFETFPVILLDRGGTVRADIPFRRAESRYSIEQTGVVLYLSGGILNGNEYSTASLVKAYARKSQFGEIFNLLLIKRRVCRTVSLEHHLEDGIHSHMLY